MSKNEYYFIPGAGVIKNLENIDEGIAMSKNDGFLWLSYIQPKIEELGVLTEKFNIHPLSIEDCFDEKQIPKIDNFPDYTHVLFNTFDYNNKILKMDEVNLFLGEKFIISVCNQMIGEGHPLNGLYDIIELEIAKTKEGPSFVMHEILDQIVDQQLDAIENIGEELIIAEDVMIDSLQDFNPSDLQRIRRDLLSLRKSLFHEREILVKINRKDSKFVPDKAIYHYSDIYDHLNKFVELIESNREILTSLIQMNLALLNNTMTKSANQTNKSVRRLTFITTIFMPLTLLTGIGGMSEYSMMTGSDNWRISYPILLGVLVLIGIADYIVLKWMGRNDKKLD